MSRYFERQPGETAKSYSAFQVFRDLGQGRKLKQACITYYGSASNLRQIQEWSRRFEWVSRAAAFDDYYLEMIWRAAVEEHERAQAGDLAEREAAHRERIFVNEERAGKLEAELLDRYEKLLTGLPLAEKVVTRMEDGIPTTYVIKPSTPNLDLSLRRLHQIASRGLPSKVEMNAQVEQRRGLTDDERREIDALRDHPDAGEFFRKLFPEEPGE